MCFLAFMPGGQSAPSRPAGCRVIRPICCCSSCLGIVRDERRWWWCCCCGFPRLGGALFPLALIVVFILRWFLGCLSVPIECHPSGCRLPSLFEASPHFPSFFLRFVRVVSPMSSTYVEKAVSRGTTVVDICMHTGSPSPFQT